MVKITNGSVEREVTQGAFDNLYSKMGFKVVENKVISKPEVTEPKKEVKVEGAKESVKDSKHPSK